VTGRLLLDLQSVWAKGELTVQSDAQDLDVDLDLNIDPTLTCQK